MPIPFHPWGSIGMDFVGPFPKSKGFDYMWVVICRLTSLVHLTPVNTTIRASELAWVFMREIVRLHGIPESIVSDRDSKFTSKFWQELHRLLGIKLLMSTSFHPQTDGASERAIRSVTQILRSVVTSDQTDWVDHLPMVEFAINSSVSASTGYAPFELTYGYLPSIFKGWDAHHAAPPGVLDFAHRAHHNLMITHDAIIASCIMQTHHANRH